MTDTRNVTREAYLRDELDTRPSLNSSVLRVLLNESPRHARDRHPRLTATPKYEWPETNAMKIGTVAHAMLLGAGARYESFNPADFLTKDGKPGTTLGTAEAKAAIAEAQARGCIVIDMNVRRDALSVTERMQAAILQDYPCWPSGESERVILWQYGLNDGTFILCRAMLDRIIERCVCVEDSTEHVHIFDPKFTGKSWSDGAIDRTAASDGWDIQAAFYTIGAEKMYGTGPELVEFPLSEKYGDEEQSGTESVLVSPVRFTFICGETYPPYDTRFVTLSDTWNSLARQRVDDGCNIFGRCVDTGVWPGRTLRHVAEVPAWMLASDEIETGQ